MEFDDYAEEIQMTPIQRETSQRHFGGAPIYIPKITRSERERRDDEIRRMYHQSRLRIWDIARQYSMSERQVRRILNAG